MLLCTLLLLTSVINDDDNISWRRLYLRPTCQLERNTEVSISNIICLPRGARTRPTAEHLKRLRGLLIVNENVLTGVISLHQQLLMMLLPLTLLWSSGVWQATRKDVVNCFVVVLNASTISQIDVCSASV